MKNHHLVAKSEHEVNSRVAFENLQNEIVTIFICSSFDGARSINKQTFFEKMSEINEVKCKKSTSTIMNTNYMAFSYS